jgi:hypothetical protein
LGLSSARLEIYGDENKSGLQDLVLSIRQTREALFRANEEFDGKIRKGEFSIGFRSALKAAYVELSFTGTLGRYRIPVEGSKPIEEFRDSRWSPNRSLEVKAQIPGTILSFEDISFRFLFWPDPKMIGTEVVRSRACGIIRFTPPASNQSAYKYVDVSVDQRLGIPMRAICYGVNGQQAKRFDLIKLHKVADDWSIQLMRVTAFDEAIETRGDHTYIEFEPAVVTNESRKL